MTDSIADKIDTIKEKYERYWGSDDALAEAKAAWGLTTEVNDHGVFEDYRTEDVARAGHSYAQIGIYKVRDGVYVHCCHYCGGTGGMGYAPSVWNSKPHATEAAARTAAIEEVLARVGVDSKLKPLLLLQAQQPTLF